MTLEPKRIRRRDRGKVRIKTPKVSRGIPREHASASLNAYDVSSLPADATVGIVGKRVVIALYVDESRKRDKRDVPYWAR